MIVGVTDEEPKDGGSEFSINSSQFSRAEKFTFESASALDPPLPLNRATCSHIEPHRCLIKHTPLKIPLKDAEVVHALLNWLFLSKNKRKTNEKNEKQILSQKQLMILVYFEFYITAVCHVIFGLSCTSFLQTTKKCD